MSKQRADQVTRTQGFPDPFEKVRALDDLNADAVRQFFDNRVLIATAGETLALFEERAFRLPAQPRLWRLSLVKEWATSVGRHWQDKAEIGEPDAASGS